MKPNERSNSNSHSDRSQAGSKGSDPKAREELRKAGEEAKQAASESVEEAKEAASEAIDDAKRKSRELANEARQRTQEALERQKKSAAVQASGIADALRESASNVPDEQAWLASGMHRAGDFMDNMSDSLDKRSISDLVRDLEHYTQRQPGVVIGAAAVAGFMLARFLKSSSSDTTSTTSRHLSDSRHGERS